jgi:hypothetical protein
MDDVINTFENDEVLDSCLSQYVAVIFLAHFDHHHHAKDDSH